MSNPNLRWIDGNSKLVALHTESINHLYEDVTNNHLKVYRAENLPSTFVSPNIFHPEAHNNTVQYTVIASGSTDRNWMAIVPHRLDKDKGIYVYDRDPLVTFLGLDGVAYGSGLIRYHGKFPTRTTTESSLHLTYALHQDAVAHLRSSVVESHEPIANADQPILDAMHYMAKQFQMKVSG